jgi:hypothetical protein
MHVQVRKYDGAPQQYSKHHECSCHHHDIMLQHVVFIFCALVMYCVMVIYVDNGMYWARGLGYQLRSTYWTIYLHAPFDVISLIVFITCLVNEMMTRCAHDLF